MKYIFAILQKIGSVVILVLGFITIFLASNMLLSKIPVNTTDLRTIVPKQNIEIFILSNGVHTDIVVPVKNEIFDWTQYISSDLTLDKNSNLEFLAIGWGDKGFYLETPTWADLKFSTAFKAATGLSSSAMHCTFYKQLNESNRCKKITISKEDYKILVKEICQSFQIKSNQFIPIQTNAVYGKNDVFYEANGSYSLFFTCNTWANSILKNANQKSALWTVYEKGIFCHYQ